MRRVQLPASGRRKVTTIGGTIETMRRERVHLWCNLCLCIHCITNQNPPNTLANQTDTKGKANTEQSMSDQVNINISQPHTSRRRISPAPPRRSTEQHQRANENSIRVNNSLTISNREFQHQLSEDDENKGCASKFCNLVDTWPVTFVIAAAVVGIVIGIGLSVWTPSDPSVKDMAILWIGLIGDLFIRSLKCIVLPLIFVSITVSVIDMLSLGKAVKIVGTTIGLYLCTTICAALIGVVSSVIFSRYYVIDDDGGESAVPADVRLGCQVDQNGMIESFLTHMTNGSVVCLAESSDTPSNNTIFRIEDVNGRFQQSSTIEEPTKLSLGEVNEHEYLFHHGVIC